MFPYLTLHVWGFQIKPQIHLYSSLMKKVSCVWVVFVIYLFFMSDLSSGEDSGKVMIWNMAPVLREEDEKNENIPKMLCQMDNHLGNRHHLFHSC